MDELDKLHKTLELTASILDKQFDLKEKIERIEENCKEKGSQLNEKIDKVDLKCDGIKSQIKILRIVVITVISTIIIIAILYDLPLASFLEKILKLSRGGV